MTLPPIWASVTTPSPATCIHFPQDGHGVAAELQDIAAIAFGIDRFCHSFRGFLKDLDMISWMNFPMIIHSGNLWFLYAYLRSLNITICNFGHVSEKLCHFQVTQPTKELVMMSIKAPKKPFKQEPISSACSKGVISGSTTNGVCFKWFSIANVRLDEVR